ncbi:hypothetical protein GcC1_086018 [Golovinomyces cichoracearum]|uniref:DNA-directed RNA polymerase n=1 Tax=Golovinomyces cichoracearum TaxID=62708 RepID=A0A420IHZ1_9PEZI|nr:hypothetical protein GcC1_086018 [Golovinomyces cichoracearum]
MFASPTYVIFYKHKVLCISISPGGVLRLMPSGKMIDSSMYHYQPSNPIRKPEKIPESGIDSIEYKHSTFFLLCPYLEDDRPSRTLLASGQTVQAICYPWAPATAKVSPCHFSKPLVTTSFMKTVQEDRESNKEAIWDILPGEDMLVCFCNLPLNYDDAMMVSYTFANYGGFETLSVCTYRFFSNDTIPALGEEICGKKYKWWKMPCSNHCVCKGFKPSINMEKNVMKIVSDPRVPSAVVLESYTAENGEYQIRVLSHAQLLTGDKISTTHGQKGVIRMLQSHDLPMIVMKDGSTMVADLNMAVGSVTSRQTVGQIFESSQAYVCAISGEKNHVAQEGDVELI